MTNVTVCSAGKKQQSTSDYPSDLDQIKAIDVLISTGYIWKSESIKKRNRLLEGKYELWVSVKKRKNYSKVTPELIEHLYKWIVNHPQVLDFPISKDPLVVTDHKILGIGPRLAYAAPSTNMLFSQVPGTATGQNVVRFVVGGG